MLFGLDLDRGMKYLNKLFYSWTYKKKTRFFLLCLINYHNMLSTRQLLKPTLRLISQTNKYSSLAQALPIRSTVNGIQRQRQSLRPLNPLQPLQQQQQPQQPQQQAQKSPSGRSRRDEEISSRFITFVNEQGQVKERCKVKDVLLEFDRSRYFLIEVDPTVKPPVCRLFDKKSLFEKEKMNKKKKQTSPESVLKEIVFGWNVSEHDMEHKLNKAAQFLDKGNKVKIDIVYKRGQKRVDKETQEQVVSTVSSWMDQYKITKKPAFAGHNCSMQFERK